MEPELFTEVGAAVRSLRSPDLVDCRRQDRRWSVKVWFGPAKPTRTTTSARFLFLGPAALGALLLVPRGDSGTTTASDDPTLATDATAAPTPTVEVVTAGDAQTVCPAEGDEWEVATLYIEHNATDEDTGVHGLFGGEAWQELCVTDPDGLSRPVYDVHVPADLTSLAVPAAFLLPDTLYELEVLALEESGNQTISVGSFRTAA
mgnify:FL=1